MYFNFAVACIFLASLKEYTIFLYLSLLIYILSLWSYRDHNPGTIYNPIESDQICYIINSEIEGIITLIFMFLYFSNLNFINTSEVYLFNKGNSKYILWENTYDKPIFGSTGTLFKIKDNTYSVIAINNSEDKDHRFAILAPQRLDPHVQIGDIKNNKEMGVKVRKEFIENNFYKLNFEGKCLSAKNNELLWKNCKYYDDNQIWSFIDPISDEYSERDDDNVEISEAVVFPKNMVNDIRKKEKEKFKLRVLRSLASIVSENDTYPYILKLSREDHYKMPKSTEIELISR